MTRALVRDLVGTAVLMLGITAILIAIDRLFF